MLTTSLLVLLASPPADAAEVVRRALVVGTNDGGGELEPLRYAEEDALKFAGVLQELGDFDPQEVSVLLSPDAATLEAQLTAAAEELAGQDEALFLFYYSGHADARGLRLGSESFAYEALKESVRAIPADVHLGVLDACQSGAISRTKGANLSTPFLVEESLAAEGEAWLTASSADEDAQESDSLGGSFFTYYLISGLRGAADKGGDGQVSLNEAYAYAYDRTVSRTGGTAAGAQHPTYDFRLQGNGELQLTEVSRATALIRFPEELDGEITIIRQPDNVPVAEVSKLTGKAMTLALEPGRYLLRRRNQGELQEVNLSLSTGAAHDLDRWGTVLPELAGAKGAADGAGEDVLAMPVDGVPVDGVPAEDAIADAPGAGEGSDGAIEVRYYSTRDEIFEDVREELEDVLGPDDMETVDAVMERARAIDLRESPAIAGLASSVLPGAGQVYNDQWVRGALFFGGVVSLSGVGYGVSFYQDRQFDGSPLGPNVSTMLGTMLYGWSIADAAWQVHEREDFRPRTGVTLSLESLWYETDWDKSMDSDGGDNTLLREAHSNGFSVDWIIKPGFSLGLDRVGLIRYTEGMDVAVGGRLMVAPEWDRLRPGAFVATGFRVGTGGEATFRPVFSGGGNIRWYLTPRYFVNYEVRYEQEAGEPYTTHGGGLGVHLGGGRQASKR